MIGALQGIVLHVLENKVLLDVGGVGYEVHVPPSIAFELVGREGGEPHRFYITTIVRENDLRLFGFRDLKTKQLFELLISVSGVGPQTAVAIVDKIAVEAFYQKVYTGNSEALVAIKGIGKKTAERMILELRDKIPQMGGFPSASARDTTPLVTKDANFEDALAALVGLGYRRDEATRVLKEIAPGGSVQEMIRQGLAALGKWKV